MIRVCIESPFRPEAALGAPEHAQELARNIEYAWDLVRDSLRRGEAPFASHLFYPNVLASGDDRDSVERQLGIDAGTAWAQAAAKIVVGTDLGITAGIKLRIAALQGRGIWIIVERRSLPAWAAKNHG